LSLASTSSMTEALDHLLKATVKIDGVDSGGVYLVEESSGELQLATHIGLSSWFIDKVSRYSAETPQARFVMRGEPIYWPNVRGILNVGKLLEREGLTSLAAIPVKSKGHVVAVLNLASHQQHEVSESTIEALEAIAAQIGGIVSRVRTEEELRRERENLAEANTALKILLKHREDDRREMEEALLVNVREFVMPNIEDLRKSRLSDRQSLSLEIVQTHLREITSPFLRTLSSKFLKLTPMEIRVADLIREGKTTKETAMILRTSERSVLFHRQNLRKKLGMKDSKANLRSYLSSLTSK
jgi:DNA-binding CsgD family transcriptional regulator/GAF domain-containing protein